MNFIFSLRKNKIPNSSVVTNGYYKTLVLQMQFHQLSLQVVLALGCGAKPAPRRGQGAKAPCVCSVELCFVCKQKPPWGKGGFIKHKLQIN